MSESFTRDEKCRWCFSWSHLFFFHKKELLDIADEVSVWTCISLYFACRRGHWVADSFPESTKKVVGMDSNFFIEPFQVLWNNIPDFWNSGRCGTALLRAAPAAQLTPSWPHSFSNLQTETPSREFGKKKKRSNIFMQLLFFLSILHTLQKISLSGKSVFVPVPLDLLRAVSFSRECQSIMCLEIAYTTAS